MSAPSIPRRHLLRHAMGMAALTVSIPLLLEHAARAESSPPPRVIKMVAQRFKFTPHAIELKAGEVVVLAIESLDFVHGLHVPDWGIRADLMPGQITRVTLHPKTAGTIEFLCDNFCGDDHETMHGYFIVKA